MKKTGFIKILVMIVLFVFILSGCNENGKSDADKILNENENSDINTGNFDGSVGTEDKDNQNDNIAKINGDSKTDGVVTKDIPYNPWGASNNRYNNGRLCIMENEYGYYFNLGAYRTAKPGQSVPYSNITNNFMSVAIHDKESDVNVLLCNKPECMHSGDENCVATYKGIIVVNTVMYEGDLYVYGEEVNGRNSSLNLYKIAYDGSSIDKVGTVYEIKREIGGNEDNTVATRPSTGAGYYKFYYFIIHKGYAYLPYYCKIGSASKGYQGGGLRRMDLKTGDVEDVYSVPVHNGAFPCRLYAEGDRVYMYFIGQSMDYGWQYYDLNTKEIKHTEWDIEFARFYDRKMKKMETYYQPIAENDKYGFDIYRQYLKDGTIDENANADNMIVTAHEKYRFDKDIKFDVDISFNEMGKDLTNRLMIYEDKLILCGEKKLVIYGIGDSNWGQKLGEFTYESGAELNEAKDYFERAERYEEEFKLDNGKIYKVVSEVKRPDNTNYNYVALHSFYCCPIDKVLKGEGSWELAFTNEWTD